MPEDAPKTPPRRAQDAPKRPQDAPKTAQETSKTPQDAQPERDMHPDRGPRRPKRPPEPPRLQFWCFQTSILHVFLRILRKSKGPCSHDMPFLLAFFVSPIGPHSSLLYAEWHLAPAALLPRTLSYRGCDSPNDTDAQSSAVVNSVVFARRFLFPCVFLAVQGTRSTCKVEAVEGFPIPSNHQVQLVF